MTYISGDFHLFLYSETSSYQNKNCHSNYLFEKSAAETAYDIVSPGPSVRKTRTGSRGRHRRQAQPVDIRDGVVKAYQFVRKVMRT